MTEEKKFTGSRKINDYEVLTDEGFVDVQYLHTTIPYTVYHLKLDDGKELKCADNHKVFRTDFSEVFVKNLVEGDEILVESTNDFDSGLDTITKATVVSVENLGYEEEMFDLELGDDTNHRYFTNGILSHNTEMAKILSDVWYGRDIIRIDMAEYQDKHSGSGLIGASAGYVGYEEGGQLTNQVRQNPYSLILLDEIEKAHKDVLNNLLSILDDGHITDNQGRYVDFKNTIIIMTSNLGAKKSMRKTPGYGGGNSVKLNDSSIASAKEHFTPELWNRIDKVVVFNPLDKDAISKILTLELNKFKKVLKEKGITINLNKSMKEKLIEEGYDEHLGARPLKRAVQEFLIDEVSDFILDTEEEFTKISVGWNNKDSKVDITIKG